MHHMQQARSHVTILPGRHCVNGPNLHEVSSFFVEEGKLESLSGLISLYVFLNVGERE